MLKDRPKRHRYPAVIISYCIWSYHRFNLSYRDIEELMAARGLTVSYETIRQWCVKFSRLFSKILRKREFVRGAQWHLDEMVIRVNGAQYTEVVRITCANGSLHLKNGLQALPYMGYSLLP